MNTNCCYYCWVESLSPEEQAKEEEHRRRIDPDNFAPVPTLCWQCARSEEDFEILWEREEEEEEEEERLRNGF